jgi:hypothetical protein
MTVAVIVGGAVSIAGAVAWNALDNRREAQRRHQEQLRNQARWDDLCRRFGPDAAARVMWGDIRIGDTMEMVLCAFGMPHDRQEKTTVRTHVLTLRWFVPGYKRRIARSVRLTNGIVDETGY